MYISKAILCLNKKCNHKYHRRIDDDTIPHIVLYCPKCGRCGQRIIVGPGKEFTASEPPIIDINEQKTQAELDEEYQKATGTNKNKFITIPCPWLKVGNLYLSVTYTGNESWRPLYKYLEKQGVTRFTIMGGRHGQHEGDEVGKVNGDDSLYRQDVEQAGTLLGIANKNIIKKNTIMLKNRNTSVNVLNVGTAEYCFKGALEKAALSGLKDGPVIFAWCYSIYSQHFYQSALKKKEIVELARANIKKSVKTIVQTTFAWVPK